MTFEDYALRVLAIILLGFLGFAVYCFVRSVLSDGVVDYCYIINDGAEYKQPYILYGHRNWKIDDRKIDMFSSMEDAMKTAENLQCKLYKK